MSVRTSTKKQSLSKKGFKRCNVDCNCSIISFSQLPTLSVENKETFYLYTLQRAIFNRISPVDTIAAGTITNTLTDFHPGTKNYFFSFITFFFLNINWWSKTLTFFHVRRHSFINLSIYLFLFCMWSLVCLPMKTNVQTCSKGLKGLSPTLSWPHGPHLHVQGLSKVTVTFCNIMFFFNRKFDSCCNDDRWTPPNMVWNILGYNKSSSFFLGLSLFCQAPLCCHERE